MIYHFFIDNAISLQHSLGDTFVVPLLDATKQVLARNDNFKCPSVQHPSMMATAIIFIVVASGYPQRHSFRNPSQCRPLPPFEVYSFVLRPIDTQTYIHTRIHTHTMSAVELEAAKQRIIDIDEHETKPIKLKLTDLRAAGNEPNSMEIIILKVRNRATGTKKHASH